jgi:hypothetical protein
MYNNKKKGLEVSIKACIRFLNERVIIFFYNNIVFIIPAKTAVNKKVLFLQFNSGCGAVG